jgi:hypothetical protein
MFHRNNHLIFLSQQRAIFAKCLLLALLLTQLTSCGSAVQQSPSGRWVAEDPNVPDSTSVDVDLGGPDSLAPGSAAPYTVTIKNRGIYADVYTITLTSELGWVDATHVPHSIPLEVGASKSFTFTINVPVAASASYRDSIDISVQGKYSSNGLGFYTGIKQ